MINICYNSWKLRILANTKVLFSRQARNYGQSMEQKRNQV